MGLAHRFALRTYDRFHAEGYQLVESQKLPPSSISATHTRNPRSASIPVFFRVGEGLFDVLVLTRYMGFIQQTTTFSGAAQSEFRFLCMPAVEGYSSTRAGTVIVCLFLYSCLSFFSPFTSLLPIHPPRLRTGRKQKYRSSSTAEKTERIAIVCASYVDCASNSVKQTTAFAHPDTPAANLFEMARSIEASITIRTAEWLKNKTVPM